MESCTEKNHGSIWLGFATVSASDTIEYLVLEMPKAAPHPYCINIGAFVRMTKLRVLRIYNEGDHWGFHPVYGRKHVTSGELELLSNELRLLEWHEYPLETLPSSFIPKTLVRLDMRGSRIVELWEENKPLQQLKEIRLSHCQSLVKIPDLTNAIHLKELHLDGCSSLSELHPSISALQELEYLTLYGCKELEILPSSLHLRSLKTLCLSGCSNLKKLPEISNVMSELEDFYLDETAIKELPESINNLIGLCVLDLSNCKELTSLPSSIHFSSLDSIHLDGCSNLEKFPEISGIMEYVPELLLDGTAIKGLPSSIDQLVGLQTLSMRNCKSFEFLPDSICNLANLLRLDLSGCLNLEKFPEVLDVMTELQELNLNGTGIKALPLSINNLTGLRVLSVSNCTKLTTLPSSIHLSSLDSLDLTGCSNLEKFPKISGIMEKLSELCLDGTAIKGLSSSIDQLLGLKKLNMRSCKSLEFLPDNTCHMVELTHLDLSGCSNLVYFPEISGIMEKMRKLCLDNTAIKGLPSSIDRLLGLKRLSIRDCKSLEFLPDSICHLVDLTHLDLSGCSALHNLPEKSGDLKSLTCLRVDESGLKHFPLSIVRLCHQLETVSFERLIDMVALTPHLSSWSLVFGYYDFSVLVHLDLSDCNLLELPDNIADLSSLKTLELCRNNFESLPVTMDRLACLTFLELEACKRLKSIPELSSSIYYMCAHDCAALESVLMPNRSAFYRTHYLFKFSNCLRLVQTNLFRDIVERHSHSLDEYLNPLRVNLSLPGSEVPDWFNHQSTGFSVSVRLPPNWIGSKFLGFAICAVRMCRGIDDVSSPSSVSCLCTFKKNCGECNFSFNLFDSALKFEGTDGFFTSNHMFLRYVSWSDCCRTEDGKLINETYTEATFQIVVETDIIAEQLRITSCGVRLVYADPGDLLLKQNMPQPQAHVDRVETGVSFMDPYESRNRITERAADISREIDSSSEGPCFFHGNNIEVQNESMAHPLIHVEELEASSFPDRLEIRNSVLEWEEESSEMAAGGGTCQTLELLSEPQTEREKEDEIMVVAAQGCQVLGSVCCCLSLSRCTMPVSRREAKREGETVTSFSNDGDVLELPTVGLVVPYSQIEGQEEKELMGEEWLPTRGPFGALCSCFYWVGELWRGTDRSSRTRGFCL